MFKEFKVKDIFTIQRAKSIAAKSDLVDGDIPYVTRTVSNNGYTRFCGNVDKVNKGNCITIGGETATAFYQPADFVAGNGMCRLTCINEKIGEKEYLFLVSALNKHTNNYSYSNARNQAKIREEIISLPVIESQDSHHEYTVDDIDWQYMQDRIAELEQDRIAELDTYLKVTGLDDYELTDEDKHVLSLSLSDSKVTKRTLWKLIAAMDR